MTIQIAPTDYLAHHLDPLSKAIDGFGGPHIVMGVIASNGEPHIYVTGNVQGNLRKEMYEALGDLLKRRASESNVTSIADGSSLQ